EVATHLQYQGASDAAGTDEILLEAVSGHRWVDGAQAATWAQIVRSSRPSAGAGAGAGVLGSALVLAGQFEAGLEAMGPGWADRGDGLDFVPWRAWALR